jgi:hypothetical protein
VRRLRNANHRGHGSRELKDCRPYDAPAWLDVSSDLSRLQAQMPKLGQNGGFFHPADTGKPKHRMFQDGCARVAGPASDTRTEPRPDRSPKRQWRKAAALESAPAQKHQSRGKRRQNGPGSGSPGSPLLYSRFRSLPVSFFPLPQIRFELGPLFQAARRSQRASSSHALRLWSGYRRGLDPLVGSGRRAAGVCRAAFGARKAKRKILTLPKSLSEFVSACWPGPSVLN